MPLVDGTKIRARLLLGAAPLDWPGFTAVEPLRAQPARLVSDEIRPIGWQLRHCLNVPLLNFFILLGFLFSPLL